MRKTKKDYENMLIKAMDKYKLLLAKYNKTKELLDYNVARINDYNELERKYKLALAENRRLKEKMQNN